VQERREANRAIAVSAIGLAATGIIELLLAVLTGSAGLLGDAIHKAHRGPAHQLRDADR
jgi:divalent metal cation (Fe/Co/Zn/Cd) transporter